MEISQLFETAFRENIINKSEIIKQLDSGIQIDEVNLVAVQEEILAKSNQKDIPFLERFFKTQMFVSFVEEKLNK